MMQALRFCRPLCSPNHPCELVMNRVSGGDTMTVLACLLDMCCASCASTAVEVGGGTALRVLVCLQNICRMQIAASLRGCFFFSLCDERDVVVLQLRSMHAFHADCNYYTRCHCKLQVAGLHLYLPVWRLQHDRIACTGPVWGKCRMCTSPLSKNSQHRDRWSAVGGVPGFCAMDGTADSPFP